MTVPNGDQLHTKDLKKEKRKILENRRGRRRIKKQYEFNFYLFVFLFIASLCMFFFKHVIFFSLCAQHA